MLIPVTICSSADFLSFFLKQKSPSARDKAKLPEGNKKQTFLLYIMVSLISLVAHEGQHKTSLCHRNSPWMGFQLAPGYPPPLKLCQGYATSSLVPICNTLVQIANGTAKQTSPLCQCISHPITRNTRNYDFFEQSLNCLHTIYSVKLYPATSSNDSSCFILKRKEAHNHHKPSPIR